MFFLEQEHIFSFSRGFIISLPTPFPTLRKQKGILLIIPLKKETETETQRTTACS